VCLTGFEHSALNFFEVRKFRIGTSLATMPVNGSTTTSNTQTQTHTVILGSGIVGLSAAYFLCESGNTRPETICLVDSSPELFHCASGLAAGFCAQDCMSPYGADAVLSGATEKRKEREKKKGSETRANRWW
jgi:glycine/D-amino acid oxidase-like deaminating enzyme